MMGNWVREAVAGLKLDVAVVAGGLTAQWWTVDFETATNGIIHAGAACLVVVRVALGIQALIRNRRRRRP
ncbi:hypothetical protein [Nitrospirillum bahiense]|uniref:Uncharacterized protein n=1 Tax=Nitrospirillum amazonense TaxID=28077 RepID=A0A560F1W6_9PROT|nr:hypothetical protein [Nitrospirillum amazonense]TWB15587.1 hypothetical protein FBZ88_12940 [Nitrospirillum amazonense]